MENKLYRLVFLTMVFFFAVGAQAQKVIQGENDFASQYPQLAAQWDRQKNGALIPEAVTSGSNRRVWWRCEKGHSYPAVIAHRVRSGSDCPYCSNHKILPGFNDLATIDPVVASQRQPYTAAGDARQPPQGLVALR